MQMGRVIRGTAGAPVPCIPCMAWAFGLNCALTSARPLASASPKGQKGIGSRPLNEKKREYERMHYMNSSILIIIGLGVRLELRFDVG